LQLRQEQGFDVASEVSYIPVYGIHRIVAQREEHLEPVGLPAVDAGRIEQIPLNHATLAEQVYQRLRDDILSNVYPSDAALPEKALAAQLNVSRVPVREALHRLAADGLVTLRPRHGAVVKSLSPQQFLDAYRVREALEELAIRLALPNLTERDMAELARLQADMRTHAAAEDAEAFFSANRTFHALFIERSQNDYLKNI
jgi:DNA-binding GntR family transcriptional regulator